MFHADGWMEGRADGQTGMTQLIVAFRSFANRPKNKEKYNPKNVFGWQNYTAMNLEKHKGTVRTRLDSPHCST